MTTPSSKELDELARRAQQGDRAALEGLLRGLQDPLYRLALRFLGLAEPARDATQEILILVITLLSTFRGESAVSTWAYRVASRHLLRERKQTRRFTFEALQASLSQPPNEIDPDLLASAEDRLLQEELFLGCTQAMLNSLDVPQRLAFVLGAILELEASECALVLEISEVAFRKRLSRARSTLDAFVAKQCGVANPENPCRCAYQVNYARSQGRLDPLRFRFAQATDQTSLEALHTFGEIKRVRRSLELYRAQPVARAPEDFAEHVRAMIESVRTLSVS
jgi:RNA polymerase sigma factor (sigma-70 family)